MASDALVLLGFVYLDLKTLKSKYFVSLNLGIKYFVSLNLGIASVAMRTWG